MKWENLIEVALKSLLRNRMRSLLTMLGIIIGVGAVISLVSIGKGAQVNIENQIASLGTNLLMIMPGNGQMGRVSQGAGSMDTLTLEDVEALNQKATLLQYVSPVIRAGGQIIAGANNWSTSIMGVSQDYLDIRQWSLDSGSFFTERDEKTRNKVAVLGQTVVKQLFGEQNPIGADIRIRSVPFKVVGVLSAKGQSANGADQDDIILAPSLTVYYRLSSGRHLNSIMATAVSADKMDAAEQEIQTLLRESHHLKSGDEDNFAVRSQTDIAETATTITNMLTLLLGAIASVSLFVGGIGIMNIMLVSVTERTREIGIRLAIGARASDVMIQFLIEAVILSLLGGLFGILAGIGCGYELGQLIKVTIAIDPLTVGIAFAFSGVVGVFFGFYPARKAAALNPIDALRYE